MRLLCRCVNLILFIGVLLLSGCNILGGDFKRPDLNENVTENQQKQQYRPKLEHTSISDECIRLIENNSLKSDQTVEQAQSMQIKVGAIGYGAPPKNYYPTGQRRLMTIRASKVDAYRALIEVVGGLHVWGSTAIEDMVLAKDRYRTFIDTYVRGARIVSVSAKEDGTYESAIEMSIDRRFLSQIMSFIDPMLAQCLKRNGGLSFASNSKTYSSPSFYYSE